MAKPAHTKEVHHEVVKHRDGSMHHHHYHIGGVVSRAKGGKVGDDEADHEVKPYDAAGSNVEKEAEERKHGGRTKKRADGGKVHGEMPKHRLDKRARGGRTGSDADPFTSARMLKKPDGHSMGGDKNPEHTRD